MTVVDSSVWIAYFKGSDTEQVEKLEKLLTTRKATLNEIIFFEVVSGIRSDTAYQEISRSFEEIGILPMDFTRISKAAAENYRHLRKKGITIRKSMDVFIATQCILLELPLLHNDRDFPPFEELGLQSA